MEENWKDILDFEGYYQASNFGRIKSCIRKHNRTEKILKPETLKNGYLRCLLNKNGQQKHVLVATAVWTAFNGPIPEGMEVNHIDEDKSNNRLDNLNLMTRKENVNWGTGTKRQQEKMINGKLSKRVYRYDLNGNLLKIYESLSEVNRQEHFSIGNISMACRGIFRKHGNEAYGSLWFYEKEKGAA